MGRQLVTTEQCAQLLAIGELRAAGQRAQQRCSFNTVDVLTYIFAIQYFLESEQKWIGAIEIHLFGGLAFAVVIVPHAVDCYN